VFRGPRHSAVILLLLMILLFSPNVSGLDDGRIGVIYIGCLARSAPFWWMRSDILFQMNYVQATLRDWAGWGPIMQADEEGVVYRLVRLYMPRNYDDLTSRFDVVILANANTLALEARNIEMLARGSEEGGLGLVMFGGWESFGAAFGRPPWDGTAVGDILPTEGVPNTYIMTPKYQLYMRIDEPEHEFMRSLPWDRKQPFMTNFHHNLVKLKPGATRLARIESPEFKDHPAMVTWELEGSDARVFSVASEIIGPSSEPGQLHTMCTRGNPWEYAIDFGANLMIYLNHRPVPQDVYLVHQLRQSMFDVGTRKVMLFGVLEFCDSFGANTAGMMERLDEVDSLIRSALPVYLDLRFEETLEIYEDVHDELNEIERDAVDLKNRALMWVYIIEWLAVTGTAMISGIFIWSIMIRRRLYRQVRTTRMRIEA